MVVDRTLEKFFDKFGEPEVIFLGFFLVFLRADNTRETSGCGFALFFTLFGDMTREIETIEGIISRVERHIFIIYIFLIFCKP